MIMRISFLFLKMLFTLKSAYRARDVWSWTSLNTVLWANTLIIIEVVSFNREKYFVVKYSMMKISKKTELICINSFLTSMLILNIFMILPVRTQRVAEGQVVLRLQAWSSTLLATAGAGVVTPEQEGWDEHVGAVSPLREITAEGL